jgi:hypothetical protein
MRKLLPFALVCLLFGCVGPSKKGEKAPVFSPSSPLFDIEALKLRLGVVRDVEDLGYEAKGFDSCAYEAAPVADCGPRQLVMVYFRLQCRESVGTVNEVTNIELMPVTTSHIRWRLGGATGWTSTDADGYGRVQFISAANPKNQRFSLTIKTNSLGVTAQDVTRIIVPRDWCD